MTSSSSNQILGSAAASAILGSAALSSNNFWLSLLSSISKTALILVIISLVLSYIALRVYRYRSSKTYS